MKIIVSKHLGFCTGVNRAYKIAINIAAKGEPTYMLGSLVHNKSVIEELRSKGVITVDSLKEIPKQATGNLIISAHGVSPEVFEKAKATGLTIIDTTCPWVKKPQELAKKLVEEGYHLIIVGDKNHTEVVGIMGWAGSNAQVIENIKDIKKVEFHEKIAVIAQTTQSHQNFEDVVNALTDKTRELKMFNTICDITGKMQRSAQETAKRSEVMLVIGDPKSANTRRLKELCEETGAKTYQIDSSDALDLNLLKGFDVIGITAGASTPAHIIEGVISKLKCT